MSCNNSFLKTCIRGDCGNLMQTLNETSSDTHERRQATCPITGRQPAFVRQYSEGDQTFDATEDREIDSAVVDGASGEDGSCDVAASSVPSAAAGQHHASALDELTTSRMTKDSSSE
jgi:hypothetical protein